MNHPTSALVDLVDGTLPPGERAAVDAHLVTCHDCRGQVAEAGAARQALSQLTPAPVPPGLADAVLARIAGAEPTAVRGRGAGPSRVWVRWASVAGAAAVIVLVAGIVLPNVRGPGDRASQLGGTYDAEAVVAPATAVEFVDQALGTQELQTLAQAYGAPAAGAAGATPVGQEIAQASSPPVAARTDDSAGAVQAAQACVATAFGDPDGTYVRLIQARFEGTPAVIGVVLSGPGGGQPPDTVDVLVASRDDCSILWSVTVRL